MKRKLLYFAFIGTLAVSIWNCENPSPAFDFTDEEELMFGSRVIAPPPENTLFIDSLKIALTNAWRLSKADSIVHPNRFQYYWNDTQEYIVLMVHWEYGYYIIVN